jgi:hypothetical protein
MRWIFQCFQSIYSVYLDDIHQISNLTPEHQHILSWVPLAKNIIYFAEPTCGMWDQKK